MGKLDIALEGGAIFLQDYIDTDPDYTRYLLTLIGQEFFDDGEVASPISTKS